MNRGRAVRVDFREGFFFDGGNHHVEPLRPRRIQHQEREASIAGNQSEFSVWQGTRLKV